jgi:hypothetical protein
MTTFYKLLLYATITFTSFTSLAAQDYVLENNQIRFKTDGIHIKSIYDKSRDLEHVTADFTSAGGIFGISYVNASTFGIIGNAEAASVDVTLINSTDKSLDFTYDNDILSASIHIELPDNEPTIHYNLEVTLKNENHFVSQVDFPRFRISKTQGNLTKQFLEPSAEGLLVSMNKEIAWFRSYPGTQSVQMGTFLGALGSVMVWADDTLGHVKSFGFKNSGSSSNIAIRHMMPYDSHTWNPGYNCRISVCGNDWQDAADIYREWAREQYWSETLLRNRTDVPEIVHNPPLVISTQLDKENTSELPDILKEWSEMAGAPIVYRPLGWEKYGNWVGIDYFPVSIGDDAFTRLNDSLKERGIITSGFIEGYHWTKRLTDGSEAVNNALSAYFDNNNGAGLTRLDPNGNIYFDTHANRYEAYLCRGTDYGKEFFQAIASGLFDRGVTQIHNDYDQLLGKQGQCWNQDHGHPVPYGVWEIDIMRNVYEEISDEAEARGIENFFITREYPQEIFNMVLHGGQERNFKLLSSKPALVPLRQYIYHEFIPVIFGLTTAGTDNDIQAAGSIIYGQIPSIAYWNNPARSPVNNNTTRLLQDYYASMISYSKEFLLYGKMLKPQIPEFEGIVHNSWEDYNGNIGIFAVNTNSSQSEINITIPGNRPRTVKFYSGDALVSSTPVLGGESVIWTLPAWRLSAIILTEAEEYPIAYAGEDQNYDEIPDDSILIAGKGFDDVEISGYEWKQLSGPPVTLINATSDTLFLKDLSEGEILLELTVTDNEGNMDSDQVTIIITCELCHTPEVNAGPDRTVSLPADTIQLGGKVSVQNGVIENTLWEKISGPEITVEDPTALNLILKDILEGEYTFRLSATSDEGFTGSDEITLRVLPQPDSIPKNSNKIIIDGIKEDAWCGKDIQINNMVLGFLDTESTISLLWDDTCLYAFLKVEDKFKIDDSGDEWWEDDAVEIFIDADDSKSILPDDNDFHFAVSLFDGKVYETHYNAIDNIELQTLDFGEYYYLEIAIPWETMGFTPEMNSTIGIEVRVIDDYDGLFADAVEALFGYSGSETPMPYQYGIMRLGNYCPVIQNILNMSAGKLNVYPNPAHNIITIESNDQQHFDFFLRDIVGKMHLEGTFSGTKQLSLNTIPSGIYFLEVIDDHNRYIEKIIKLRN